MRKKSIFITAFLALAVVLTVVYRFYKINGIPSVAPSYKILAMDEEFTYGGEESGLQPQAGGYTIAVKECELISFSELQKRYPIAEKDEELEESRQFDYERTAEFFLVVKIHCRNDGSASSQAKGFSPKYLLLDTGAEPLMPTNMRFVKMNPQLETVFGFSLRLQKELDVYLLYPIITNDYVNKELFAQEHALGLVFDTYSSGVVKVLLPALVLKN